MGLLQGFLYYFMSPTNHHHHQERSTVASIPCDKNRIEKKCKRKGDERNQNKNEKLTQWDRFRAPKLIKVKVLFFVLSKKKFMMRNAIIVLDYINETENIQKYVRSEQNGMF